MGTFIDFAYIKQHADFGAVLAHYDIAVNGDGNELRCCCPFHDDGNPSMTINHEKSVFNCHAAGCGEKGNILDFVANMESLDLRPAAVKLAEICKIEVSAPKRGAGKARQAKAPDKKKALTKEQNVDRRFSQNEVGQAIINEENAAAATKTTALKQACKGNEPLKFQLTLDPLHEYGTERALSQSAIERFEMGYCSRGLMKGRWCIPIHNIEGELVAYAGRWIGKEQPDDEPKYKLPKDFNKSLVLFNLHRVLAARQNEVVLVEGVFDVIRLHELGIPAVALLGSSVSDEQVALLSGMACVHVMFDGGAVKARRKVVDRLAQEVLVRSVVLPDGEDPASVDVGYIVGKVPEFVG